MLVRRSRLLLSAILVIVLVFIFCLRLVQLQILHGEQYERFSRQNSLRRLRVAAPRGKILDRNGVVLAENRPSFAILVHWRQVSDRKQLTRALVYLLQWPEERVTEALGKKSQRSVGAPSVVIHHLNPEQVAQIRGRISRLQTEKTFDFDLKGIQLSPQFDRVYPSGEAFGHLLGYTREVNGKDLSYWQEKEPGRVVAGDQVGVKGVEKAFEGDLRGYAGFHLSLVDAFGREVEWEELGIESGWQEILSQPGRALQLTVDAELTKVAYRAFGDKVGALVALNPQNGEILSMVSRPSFHPQLLTGRISYPVWEQMRDHPQKILLNRPLQAAYPPGSIYKIVTALAVLAEGKVRPGETIRCNGHYRVGGRNWRCWNRGGHGSLTLAQALKHSCDVFFYHMGERLGPDRLAHYAKLLGLGAKTGVLADYERSGLVPTSQWKALHRKQPWKNSDNLGNAIGQGFNLVTPLQSAMMVAQFANGGKKIRPHLRLGDSKLSTKTQLNWGLKEQQFIYLKNALVQVVEGSGGTGRRARVPGVTVGGKTGTAQVIALERKGQGKGNTEDHAWFVAFAPAENPEIAIAVVVEHGGGGGSVAAPIAQQVLAAYFKKGNKTRKTD